MTFRALALAASGLLVSLAACGPEVPSFPLVGPDAGARCSEQVPCDDGQLCLAGRCFAECDADADCGPREACGSMGACVPKAGADGGPADPCDLAACGTASPMRPLCRNGECLQCQTPVDCPAETPVCDVARGTCVIAEAAPAACSVCNTDAECAAFAGSSCIARSAPEPSERVCLAACVGGGCEPGFQCDATAGVCKPVLGSSCFGLRAAATNTVCTGAADCAPVGATPEDGLFSGSCFDPLAGTATTCHQPCRSDTDCPGAVCITAIPGMTVPNAGYCAPPPP